MHWVYATDPNGNKVPVNLAAMYTMSRGKLNDKEVTVLFLGGSNGQADYAKTIVVETWEELFALTPIPVAAPAKTNGHAGASEPSGVTQVAAPLGDGPRPRRLTRRKKNLTVECRLGDKR